MKKKFSTFVKKILTRYPYLKYQYIMRGFILTTLAILLLSFSHTTYAQQQEKEYTYQVKIVNSKGKPQPNIYAYYETNKKERNYFKSDSNGIMTITSTNRYVEMRIDAEKSKGYLYNSFSPLKQTIVYNTQKDYETALNEKVYNIIDCDEYPEFPGGLEEYRNYIRKKINTEKAKLPGTSHFPFGRVIIQCVIDKEGCITLPCITKSMDTYMDKLALEIIQSMPKWKPAKIGNKPVSCLYFPLVISFGP